MIYFTFFFRIMIYFTLGFSNIGIYLVRIIYKGLQYMCSTLMCIRREYGKKNSFFQMDWNLKGLILKKKKLKGLNTFSFMRIVQKIWTYGMKIKIYLVFLCVLFYKIMFNMLISKNELLNSFKINKDI